MLNFLILLHIYALGTDSQITTEYNGNVCYWQIGDPMTSSDSNLGQTADLQACHELVLSSEPNAVAATRHVNSGMCFAEFGSISSLVQMSTSQTCVFGTTQTTSSASSSSSDCASGQIFCDALQSCISSKSVCPSPTIAPSIEQPPYCELSSYPSSQSSLDCGVISLPSVGTTCAVTANSEYVCSPETAACTSYNTWTPVTCSPSCSSHDECSSDQYCYVGECKDLEQEGASCQPDVVMCISSLYCMVAKDETTGICATPSSCLSDSDCTDQYCGSEGACVDYLAEGAACSEETECGPLRVCALNVDSQNVCQNAGTCRGSNCGCPDAFLNAWCTSENSLVGPCCARSESNCDFCGGVWCTEELCEYYKIDTSLTSSDVSPGAATFLTLEGVFERLTDKLYQAGDRFLYLGDSYKWMLNHTRSGIATSSSDIVDYVQTNADWEFSPFDSPSSTETMSVAASCTSKPPSITQREVEGSAAAAIIYVQMAYQSIQVEKVYAEGGDGASSVFATTPHELNDVTTRLGSLSGDIPEETLATMIRYFADASIKTECRDYFATLLLEDNTLNTEALDSLLEGTNLCTTYTLEDLQAMRQEPANPFWGLCAGTSDYSSRGFPSCLWMNWHGLTVNRNEIGEAEGLNTIVRNFFTFYSKVYSSAYRSQIISVVTSNFFHPEEDTDCSWLMYIHNLLNSISAANEDQNYFGTRDPHYPKIQWPSEDMCWNCLTNITKAEEFLRVFYADDAVSDSELEVALEQFPQQECVLGSTYSINGDGLEPCALCTTCLSTTVAECSTTSNSECMVCQTNDDCVSDDHFCSGSGCVPFLTDGQSCVDIFFGILDVECAEDLECDTSRTGTCRKPCTEGYDYSSDGFEPCNRCQLCLGPIENECTLNSNTECMQLTPSPDECDLSSGGTSIGSAYPILDLAGSQFTDSVLSLVLEVPMNFDSSNTRISFVDATYDDLNFDGTQNEYWSLVQDVSACRTYYTVTVDWANFWTMDWGGLEFIYVVAEDQYAYTGQMFFQTSQINDDGLEQTAEWTIPFVFVQPSHIYIETDSSDSSSDGAVSFRSTDDHGNPIIIGLAGIDTQISWVSMASVLSNDGDVEIDVRFYTSVPYPKRILETGYRVESVDNTISKTKLSRILDCECVDTASTCAMMINWCHIFGAVCKQTCNACDTDSCKQFWQLIITLDDICDVKGRYVLGLQQYDPITDRSTFVDSGVTLTANSACMSIGDGSTMQSSTNVFGEPHIQALRLGFNVGDTVYFETKVVSVLADGQKQSTRLKEVHVYQEATRITDVIYRDGKTLAWGANAGFSVDDVSDDSVYFSFRLDPEFCVTLVDDTRVIVTAIVEVIFESTDSRSGRRRLAFVTDSNRVQSQNTITIFGTQQNEQAVESLESTNSDWKWYLAIGILLTISFCIVLFLAIRKRHQTKDVVSFSQVNSPKIAT